MIPPRSVGVQCATGEVRRNNSRENEVAGPEQIRRSAVDVSGGDGKVQCGKEQYCMHVYVRTVYVCMCIYVLWGRIIVCHSDYPATLHSFSSEVFQGCDTRTGYKPRKVWRRKDAGGL